MSIAALAIDYLGNDIEQLPDALLREEFKLSDVAVASKIVFDVNYDASDGMCNCPFCT